MLTSTPFNEQLRHLNKGTLNDELTEQLTALVKAVRETGKAGSLTLTIKVAMLNKADEDVVKVSPAVSCKLPENDRGETIMYSTADGDLLRESPYQAAKPELRQVETSGVELRTVSDAPKTVKKVI